jgi:hypothetical protein
VLPLLATSRPLLHRAILPTPCAPCLQAVHGNTWTCLTSQYGAAYVTTPHFVLQAGYDAILGMYDAQLSCDPVFSPQCTNADKQWWQVYHNTTLGNLAGAMASDTNGIFVDACCPHCQSVSNGHAETYGSANARSRRTHTPPRRVAASPLLAPRCALTLSPLHCPCWHRVACSRWPLYPPRPATSAHRRPGHAGG